MDWFTPLVGFLGVGIGFGYQEYRIRRERKDKYKDMVFERRLDAHQGAHYWCERLVKSMMPHRLMKAEGVGVARGELVEAQEWLRKNTLYLDEGSREKLAVFFLYVAKTVMKYKDEGQRKNINVKEEARELSKNAAAVLHRIERGIGCEYLPERKISSEGIDVEQLLDEAVEGMERIIGREKG